jgi:hypothetical protein
MNHPRPKNHLKEYYGMSQCQHVFLSGASAATLIGGGAASASLAGTIASPALMVASVTTTIALAAVAGLLTALPVARVVLRRADVRRAQ